MSTHARAEGCDWAQDRRVSWIWPAAFALVAAGWLAVPDPAGSLLAATGFAVSGALCTGNAMHCRRAHCVVTGPLYLVAAILFLARVAGAAVPGGLIVAASIVGTIIAFVPEWVGTRYLRGTTDASSLATTGTLLAAGLVGACCLGPSLFVLFGVSVAALGSLGALEPYRLPFLTVGLACWAAAYRARRETRCTAETCGTPDRRSLSGMLLWGSLVTLLAASVYPYIVARLADQLRRNSMLSLLRTLVGVVLLAGIATGDTRTVLELSGLRCATCSLAVTKALRQVSGVHDVQVSQDEHRATVIAEETVPPDALAEAVRRLGYGANVLAQ